MKAAHILLALALTACGSSAATESSSTASSAGSESSESPAFTQIAVSDVQAGLAEQSLAVFDSNRRETYEQHHVPGATWLRYDAVTAEALPSDTSTQLVFYCANQQCTASHQAAERAHELGYANVSVMGDGIEGWIAAGLPVESASPTEAAE